MYGQIAALNAAHISGSCISLSAQLSVYADAMEKGALVVAGRSTIPESACPKTQASMPSTSGSASNQPLPPANGTPSPSTLVLSPVRAFSLISRAHTFAEKNGPTDW